MHEKKYNDEPFHEEFEFFSTCIPCNSAHGENRSNLYDVMALLMEIQSSVSLLNTQARWTQLECCWCHSLSTFVLPRAS